MCLCQVVSFWLVTLILCLFSQILKLLVNLETGFSRCLRSLTGRFPVGGYHLLCLTCPEWCVHNSATAVMFLCFNQQQDQIEYMIIFFPTQYMTYFMEHILKSSSPLGVPWFSLVVKRNLGLNRNITPSHQLCGNTRCWFVNGCQTFRSDIECLKLIWLLFLIHFAIYMFFQYIFFNI